MLEADTIPASLVNGRTSHLRSGTGLSPDVTCHAARGTIRFGMSADGLDYTVSMKPDRPEQTIGITRHHHGRTLAGRCRFICSVWLTFCEHNTQTDAPLFQKISYWPAAQYSISRRFNPIV